MQRQNKNELSSCKQTKYQNSRTFIFSQQAAGNFSHEQGELFSRSREYRESNNMNPHCGIQQINSLAKNKTPFLFIIDYTKENIIIEELATISSEEILFDVNGQSNFYTEKEASTEAPIFTKKPIDFKAFEQGFSYVLANLKQGNSYLTNYTCETPISTNLSLKDIFRKSEAKYKLLYKNLFVVFSPETFIKITDGKIFSFPMKGTIDASIPEAEKIILNDLKETAEHATITDLIRNDLSKVATNINVDRYRYIDKINTNHGELLQISSQISGELPMGYQANLGDIIFSLLPAGSITGAPKQKTIEIIKEAETYKRGFYTGVFGLFDGKSVDCGVMIRFIENKNGKLVFKSGGGITVNSKAHDEYDEMIKKVYLPFH
ncbi:MAG: aminodeoxychorismate synthase component I [Salinivirgaceae bacterium]|nr:aminodeoxychorismate synthase component I [Salinivirgaceae bacterium]